MNKSRKIAIAVLVAIIVLVVAPTVAVILLVRNYGPDVVRTARSQFHEMQNQVSDRDLRNAVAQIELHKLRSGKYPRTLQDLRYLSQMDQSILMTVAYFPNKELTAYYVESKGLEMLPPPKLEYPDDFWQGTGFRQELKPSTPPQSKRDGK